LLNFLKKLSVFHSPNDPKYEGDFNDEIIKFYYVKRDPGKWLAAEHLLTSVWRWASVLDASERWDHRRLSGTES
jgi:hypothetical protein